jgi:hypothetical protein
MSTVGNLHFSSRPAAIPRGVRAIIVDAVDGELWIWAAAHVGKKVLVGIPARIDRDASAAVVAIVTMAWASTSRAYVNPRLPFWTSIVSMLGVRLTNTFKLKATASLRAFCFQMCSISDAFISAVAAAQPPRMSAGSVGKRENGQAAKALAGQVMAHTYYCELGSV